MKALARGTAPRSHPLHGGRPPPDAPLLLGSPGEAEPGHVSATAAERPRPEAGKWRRRWRGGTTTPFLAPEPSCRLSRFRPEQRGAGRHGSGAVGLGAGGARAAARAAARWRAPPAAPLRGRGGSRLPEGKGGGGAGGWRPRPAGDGAPWWRSDVLRPHRARLGQGRRPPRGAVLLRRWGGGGRAGNGGAPTPEVPAPEAGLPARDVTGKPPWCLPMCALSLWHQPQAVTVCQCLRAASGGCTVGRPHLSVMPRVMSPWCHPWCHCCAEPQGPLGLCCQGSAAPLGNTRAVAEVPCCPSAVRWHWVMVRCHNSPHTTESCHTRTALVTVLLSAEFQQLWPAAKSPSISEPCTGVWQSSLPLQRWGTVKLCGSVSKL